jgi:hypothetical protein
MRGEKPVTTPDTGTRRPADEALALLRAELEALARILPAAAGAAVPADPATRAARDAAAEERFDNMPV